MVQKYLTTVDSISSFFLHCIASILSCFCRSGKKTNGRVKPMSSATEPSSSMTSSSSTQQEQQTTSTTTTSTSSATTNMIDTTNTTSKTTTATTPTTMTSTAPTTSSNNEQQQQQVVQQQKQRIRKMKSLTNTNTDLLCHDSDYTKFSSLYIWFQKWLYRFNLWTGLYMLNPTERFIFHFVTWTSMTAFITYVYVFMNGFYHGYYYHDDYETNNNIAQA